MNKPKRIQRIACQKCTPTKGAKPLPVSRIRQGRHGNCGFCYRQMRILKPKESE